MTKTVKRPAVSVIALRRILPFFLAIAGLLVVSATPSLAAAGKQGVSTNSAGCAEGFDITGGAYAYACTYYADNGGTMVYVYVEDKAADGKCAHAALRWLHDNGSYYYDYGMYVCGAGAYQSFDKGPRNQTLYQKVDLQVFVDNGAVNTFNIETF